MSEIKCPKCGEAFTVDESGYIAIVGQVRDAEFQKELAKREKIFKSEKENELKLMEANAKAQLEQSISQSKQEIERLNGLVKSTETEKQIALKDSESKAKDELAEKNMLIERLKEQLVLNETSLKKEKESELKLMEANAKVVLEQSLSESKQEIERLNGLIKSSATANLIALKDEEVKNKEALSEKDKLIAKLEMEAYNSKTNTELQVKNIKDDYELKLKEKDATIDYFKDLKAKLSTKMVGESLEQHCEIEFNRLRATGFQNAYFEKDNDAKTGSKGDYIFKSVHQRV